VSTFTIHQAKTNLSKLIARAEAGEEVVIMRGKEPVARLEPLGKKRGKRVPGLLKGKVPELPDAFFFEPLPEEELRAWEGQFEGPR
jgi:antitoxin (DNA-binding transcriptional repressor) of toxin-antitoxin stability system